MQDKQNRQTPARAREGKRRRERNLHLRIHGTDLVNWRAAAKRDGVKSLSSWLRAAADQGAVCGTDPRAWRRDLVSLQRQLNSAFEATIGALTGGSEPPRDPTNLGAIVAEITSLRQDVRTLLLGRRPFGPRQRREGTKQ